MHIHQLWTRNAIHHLVFHFFSHMIPMSTHMAICNLVFTSEYIQKSSGNSKPLTIILERMKERKYCWEAGLRYVFCISSLPDIQPSFPSLSTIIRICWETVLIFSGFPPCHQQLGNHFFFLESKWFIKNDITLEIPLAILKIWKSDMNEQNIDDIHIWFPDSNLHTLYLSNSVMYYVHSNLLMSHSSSFLNCWFTASVCFVMAYFGLSNSRAFLLPARKILFS